MEMSHGETHGISFAKWQNSPGCLVQFGAGNCTGEKQLTV